MVPLFMTNVNHAPLMSYFPCVPGSAGGRCGSGGSGIGAAVTPSSPSAHWMQGVRAAPVPLVGSPASLDTIPAAPPTPFVDPNIDPKKLEDDKKDDEKKKDDKKSGGNRELRTTPPTPTPMVRPVSLPAQQPTPLPQGVSLPAAYPTMPTLTTPTGPRVLETPTNSTTGSRSPSRGGILDRAFSIFKSSPPPVPVAAPDAWTYPMLQQTGGSEPTVTKTIARGAAPTEPTAPTASESGIQQATHREPVRHFARPGSCPAGCADGSGNCYLGIGIPSEKYPPCMGHGNLDGYRFVKAVVHPCPPSGPLAVNACYGMRPPGCPESPIQALVDHFFPGNRRPGCAPTGVIVTNAEPIVGPSVYPPFPEHTPMTLPPVEVHAPAMR